jgi:two-component system CheB/CheR fusion protein
MKKYSDKLMLRIRKGTDFTYYKQTTIRRRILRRMAIKMKLLLIIWTI